MTITRFRVFASAFALLTAGLLIQVLAQTPARRQGRAPGMRAANQSEKIRLSQQYGRLPLSFERNAGQAGASVQFLSRGRGYTLFLTPTGAVMGLHPSPGGKRRAEKPAPGGQALSATLKMQLVGADPAPNVAGHDPLPGKSNYFLGNDPSKWRSDIPNYTKVQYSDVYPGIDLVYYGNGRQLEHDFVVKPGASPEKIRLGFPGTTKLSINEAGDLLIAANGETVSMNAPVIYQETGGVKRSISGRYSIQADQQVAFDVDAYDPQQTLVIDPVLVYSTYLGGAGDDFGTDIAVDANGFAYVVGQTISTDFPVTAVRPQAANAGGPNDVFVTKLSQDGASLVYSTYLGGSGTDEGIGVAVDSSGNAYITGDTDSMNYPTTAGALQTLNRGGGGDAFVTKLNSTGSALVYSTFLGGNSFDIGYSLTVNSAGEAFVAGQTFSSDFPVANNQHIYTGFSDAFVTRLNAAGNGLVYSTYWGGDAGDDQGRGIAVDAAGNAYIGGQTTAADYVTTAGAFQRVYGGGGFDAIVFKLGPTGNVVYSTLVGGSDTDQARGIALDAAGDVYITGQTFSVNFPLANAFQPVKAGNPADPTVINRADAFMTKLNPTGSGLIFSTYFGGSLEDQGDHGIATDSAGNMYVTGFTHSADLPLAGSPFQATYGGGGYDCYVAKFAPTGALLYSTYLGGIFSDLGRALAVDTAGNAYVVGFTNSGNLPTKPGSTLAGGFDAFVAKIANSVAPVASLSATSVAFGNQPVATLSAVRPVTLTNTGNAPLTLTGIVATGDYTQTNNCPASLAAAGSCTINITFTPIVTGVRLGTMTIADNAAGTPHTIALSGTGTAVAAPILRLSTNSVAFGSTKIGKTSAAVAATLKNSGTTPVIISGIAISGDYLQSNNCVATLAAATSCSVNITFRPTAAGLRTGTVTITDNATGAPHLISLSGTGLN